MPELHKRGPYRSRTGTICAANCRRSCGPYHAGTNRRFRPTRRRFGFETTLSGRSYLNVIVASESDTTKLTVFFLWAATIEVTSSRIRERVLQGGHNIPEVDQYRRFGRSLENFLNHYRLLADAWTLFNNSGLEPFPIAEQAQGEIRIIETETYQLLMEQYGQLG